MKLHKLFYIVLISTGIHTLCSQEISNLLVTLDTDLTMLAGLVAGPIPTPPAPPAPPVGPSPKIPTIPTGKPTPRPTVAEVFKPLTLTAIPDQTRAITNYDTTAPSTFSADTTAHYPSFEAVRTIPGKIHPLIKNISRDAAGRLQPNPDQQKEASKIAEEFLRNAQKATGTATEDQLRDLIKEFMGLIAVNPLVMPTVIDALVAVNQYTPAQLFIRLGLGEVAPQAHALQAEIERELRLIASNFPKGDRARGESQRILGQAFHRALLYLELALQVYNKYSNINEISALDKDLFVSMLFCTWANIVNAYNNMIKRFATEDINNILKYTAPNARNNTVSVYQYLQDVNALMTPLIKQYPNGTPQLLDLLTVYVDNKNVDAIIKFIDRSLSPQTFNSFIRCNQSSFDTEDKLKKVNQMLDSAESLIARDQDAVKRLGQLKQEIRSYTTNRQKEKEANNLFDKLASNPDAYRDEKTIDDLIRRVKETLPESQEKKQILSGLETTRRAITIGKDIGPKLGLGLLTICHQGVCEGIQKEIRRYVYDVPEYKDAEAAAKPLILQAVLSYLIGTTYRIEAGREPSPVAFCARCTYNAAWLMAEELLKMYPTASPWVRAMLILPYWVPHTFVPRRGQYDPFSSTNPSLRPNKEQNPQYWTPMEKLILDSWYPKEWFIEIFREFFEGQASV